MGKGILIRTRDFSYKTFLEMLTYKTTVTNRQKFYFSSGKHGIGRSVLGQSRGRGLKDFPMDFASRPSHSNISSVNLPLPRRWMSIGKGLLNSLRTSAYSAQKMSKFLLQNRDYVKILIIIIT